MRPLESFDFFPRKLYAEDKTILPMPDRGPVPHGPDLDDLIFQNEGWLTSDR